MKPPTHHNIACFLLDLIASQFNCAGEPITANQYFGLGRVTEFKYGIKISENKNKIQVRNALQKQHRISFQ